ncbi:MAG: hypothetical protein ACRCY3_08875 [Sphingorhabdus sp.]
MKRAPEKWAGNERYNAAKGAPASGLTNAESAGFGWGIAIALCKGGSRLAQSMNAR